MGKVVKVPINSVRPIQLALVQEDFRNLLEIYDSGKLDRLLPSIARVSESGEYVVLNGTHRNMLNAILGLDARLYVPDGKMDLMFPKHFPGVEDRFLNDANNSIMHGFEQSLMWMDYVEELGVKSFQDLMQIYGIKSIDDVRKFANGHITHQWAMKTRANAY